MGFRIIRENTEDYKRYLNRQKSKQLESECEKWLTLTQSRMEPKLFLNRFETVKEKGKGEQLESLAQDISSTILTKKIHISDIQDMIDLNHFIDLLPDFQQVGKTS